MSNKAHTDLARRWVEALNQGGAAARIEEFYTTDYVYHSPGLPTPIRGLEGMRSYIEGIETAFPDGRYVLEDVLVDGDKVAVRITARITHAGTFNGIPATGKQAEFWLMSFIRIADGKFAEEWELGDSLSLLQQLGVVSLPD